MMGNVTNLICLAVAVTGVWCVQSTGRVCGVWSWSLTVPAVQLELNIHIWSQSGPLLHSSHSWDDKCVEMLITDQTPRHNHHLTQGMSGTDLTKVRNIFLSSI